MIALEVPTNTFVTASATSRSFLPRWFQSTPIAPANQSENRSAAKQGKVKESVSSTQTVARPLRKTTSVLPIIHHSNKLKMNSEQQQPLVADAVSGLSLIERANVQARLGRYQKSMELLEMALNAQRHQLGDHHVTLAETLSRRASIRGHFGFLDEACVDLKKAAIIVEQLAKSQPDMAQVHQMHLADILVKLSLIHLRLGDGHHQVEAMMSLEKAFAIKRDLLGPHDASVADLVCLIARVYYQQNDYMAASVRYQEALSMYKAARVPKDDPRVVEARRQASCRNMLGHGFWNDAAITRKQCAFV